MLGLFVPQFLEQCFHVRLVHVAEDLAVEARRPFFRTTTPPGKPSAGTCSYLARQIRGLHIEDVVGLDCWGFLAKQCEPALGELFTVLAPLTADRFEYRAGVVRSTASSRSANCVYRLLRFDLDQSGEIDGVHQREVWNNRVLVDVGPSVGTADNAPHRMGVDLISESGIRNDRLRQRRYHRADRQVKARSCRCRCGIMEKGSGRTVPLARFRVHGNEAQRRVVTGRRRLAALFESKPSMAKSVHVF